MLQGRLLQVGEAYLSEQMILEFRPEWHERDSPLVGPFHIEEMAIAKVLGPEWLEEGEQGKSHSRELQK